MAPGKTTVRQRPYPLQTDPPDVAGDMTLLARSVDTAPNVTSGAFSARPNVLSTAPGDEFYATDEERYFRGVGSAWGTLLVAEDWIELTPASYVTVINPVRVRREGDLVRLSGLLQNATGETLNGGATLATGMPAAFEPVQGIQFSAVVAGGAQGYPVQIGISVGSSTIALSTLGDPWPNGTYLPLDGLVYPLT